MLLWSDSLLPVYYVEPLSRPSTAPFPPSEACLALYSVGKGTWLLSEWKHILLSQGGDFVFLGLQNLIGIGNGASVLQSEGKKGKWGMWAREVPVFSAVTGQAPFPYQCTCSPAPHLMCVLAAGEQGQIPGQPLLSASLVLDFLFQMKTGPFAEHSNQLWNISAVPSWSKVNQGLIRMYKAEVSGVWPSRLPLLSLSAGVSLGLLVLSELGDLRT